MGLLAILVITPMLAFASIRVPLHPSEFQTGLMVFTLVPTTLSQGQTLVSLHRSPAQNPGAYDSEPGSDSDM